MRWTLQVKQVAPAGGAAGGPMNPAMQARTGHVAMDPGRPWSGDLYDEGPVTDPASGYAHFGGGEDVEAWLDRNPDKTLTGWVREGADIYRYSDVEAWALDVDGAQMTRTDSAAAAPVDGAEDSAADGGGGPVDPAAAPDQGATQGDPAADLAPADGTTSDPNADVVEPPVAQTPTTGLENPFAIPDDAATFDPNAAAVPDPNAYPAVDPNTAPVDPNKDPSADPNVDPNVDLANPDDETDKDKLFGGKNTQEKTHPAGIDAGPPRKARGTIRLARR